jgi:hypothetical protein
MTVTLDSSTQAQPVAAPAAAQAADASNPFSEFTEELGQATSDAAATASTTTSPLQALFPGVPADWAVTPDPAPTPAPTMESVFGSQPFLDNPVETLPDGSSYSLNPIWFATPATAATVATMLGGTVVESDEFTAPNSPVQQQQPNEMVQLSNGTLINAGQVAWLYDHGFSQTYIDASLSDMVNGAETA